MEVTYREDVAGTTDFFVTLITGTPLRSNTAMLLGKHSFRVMLSALISKQQAQSMSGEYRLLGHEPLQHLRRRVEREKADVSAGTHTLTSGSTSTAWAETICELKSIFTM